MPPDQSPPCTFSALFNQLKHLRCHQDISDVVIDVSSQKYKDHIEPANIEIDSEAAEQSGLSPSLTDPGTWRPVFLKSLGDGIVVVPGVISLSHCKVWFNRLLQTYPRAGMGFRSNVDLQSLSQQSGDILQSNLRWLTFGYHYCWDTKMYDLHHPDPVPHDLEYLFCSLSRILRIDFRPEAGIINYYTCKSRISPHSDVAEENLDAPLFSLSLGGSAVLMVGGVRKEDEPVVPILLSDGDLVIMRGKRRLSFHAVPKIYCPPKHSQCSGIVRINVNARQVF